MPKQSASAIASFLNMNPGAQQLFLTNEDKITIGRVTSRDAYELAKKLVERESPGKCTYLVKLIEETWAAHCLREFEDLHSPSAAELRYLFKQVPDGCLAQIKIIEALYSIDELRD